MQLDVTSEESVKAAREEISKKTELLDVLINNAGINGGSPPYTALEGSTDEFLAAFNTNVISVARVTGAFIDLLRDSPGPRIVNVSSSVGSLSLQSDPGWPAYIYVNMPCTLRQKQVEYVYYQLAYELRDTALKVNSVCPGYTKTDFTSNNGGEIEIAGNGS